MVKNLTNTNIPIINVSIKKVSFIVLLVESYIQMSSFVYGAILSTHLLVY